MSEDQVWAQLWDVGWLRIKVLSIFLKRAAFCQLRVGAYVFFPTASIWLILLGGGGSPCGLLLQNYADKPIWKFMWCLTDKTEEKRKFSQLEN